MNDNHRKPDRAELDEAQLTAYALVQLGEEERAEVEAKLAHSDKARQFVEQTRALSEHVYTANRQEPSPQPSAELRAAVEERLQKQENPSMKATRTDVTEDKPRRNSRVWIMVAAAVCLLIAASPLLLPSFQPVRETAHIDRAAAAKKKADAEKELAQVGVALQRHRAARADMAYDRGDDAADDRGDDAAELESQDSPATDRDLNDLARAINRRVNPGGTEEVTTGAPTAVPPPMEPSPPPADPTASGPSVSPNSPIDGLLLRETQKSPYLPEKLDNMTNVPNGQVGDRQPGGQQGQPSPGQQPLYREGGRLGRPHDPGQLASGSVPRIRTEAVPDECARLQKFALPSTSDRSLEEERFGDKPDPFGTPMPDSPTPGTEQYDEIVENEFTPAVGEQARTTFSIDVDTASYANVRRFLNSGRLPPPNAVRIEELINYFSYDYPEPAGEHPFSVNMETAACPWNTAHRLLRIGLKGQEIDRGQRGPSNLVFLLDVSGSMSDADKLPLVKQGMKLLAKQLGEDDRVAIVTYASGTQVRLESTRAHQRQTILDAIDALSAGGSTHGSAGIQLAYEQASQHFIEGGTNRVLLATDGDLNVGVTDDDELVKLITEKAKSGVFLTVLGFGTGNLKDSKLEKLADKGNGTYAYVDGVSEAHKVLVEQLTGSLVTIAKDVKIQVVFNPAEVYSYRLIGYENRVLANRDFADDKKDAGEIGAGHTVTALYEIVPATEARTGDGAAGLKYQRVPRYELTDEARSGEILTLRLRYKQPEAAESQLLERVLSDSGKRFGEASPEFRFASAVAAFGMRLRGSRHAGPATLAAVEEYAAGAIGDDPGGYRAEFVDLVRRARKLRGE